MALNTAHLTRCIQTLEAAVELLRGAAPDSIHYEVYRNAVVKGFELALETSGKLLRKALRAYGVSSQAADRLTYKDVFRHGAKHGLVAPEAVERWFAYRDNRNNTAHDYGEAFARETLTLIPAFLDDARALQAGLAVLKEDRDA